MISTFQPPGYTTALRFCVTTLVSAALFFAWSAPASAATDKYLNTINANLASAYGPGVTTLNANLDQLKTATVVSINADLKHALDYVNSALYLRSTVATDASPFSLLVANGLPSPTVATKTQVAQGAITAAPVASMGVTTSVLSSPNGAPITDTVAYGKSLVKTKAIEKNYTAAGQIAQGIASTYPVVLDPLQYSTDPRIALVAGLADASKGVTEIAEGVGQTMAITYNPQDTTSVPPYDQRERLAQFSGYLAKHLSSSEAALAAQGLILSNPEVAPRIVNEMLVGNSKIDAAKFLKSVAHMLDSEETMEIAAAISFGTGYNSLAPNVPDSNPYPTAAPFLSAANASKLAPKIAEALGAELVLKSGSSVVSDISGMAAIISNKLAALVTTPSSFSTYQKAILSVATAASDAAKKSKLNATTQAAIAQTVAQYVAESIKAVYGTTYSANDKTSIYVQLINNLNKISGSNVTASVNNGLAGPNFAWGPLNPDETPNTNF